MNDLADMVRRAVETMDVSAGRLALRVADNQGLISLDDGSIDYNMLFAKTHRGISDADSLAICTFLLGAGSVAWR